jgi:hypothetical protein
MGVKIGTTAITDVGKIKLGTTNITKVYQGVNQIWPTTVITSYSYSVKLGTTTSNVCTATPTTVYSNSSTWVFGAELYTDAALTNYVTGFDYAVISGTNDIWAIFWGDGATYLNGDTGNDCVTAYAYSVQLSTTIGGVCSASPSIVYSSSATWEVGMTLYATSGLTTLKTGFSYVLNDITTDIYNLNSTTAVVGSDTGSNC